MIPRTAQILLASALLLPALHAATVDYDLVIAEKSVNFSGRDRTALSINGSIPGPTLRFREGDTARINVRNNLASETTSIHWHGLLVPNSEDGVPYLTTPPIQPGTTHTFEFPLRHPGTYWYHSHTGLQEQRGVYGSIVITPRRGERVKADIDHVAVLSDWTDENPKEVMRTLMRGSEWYGIEKGNAQSLLGAVRSGHLADYISREKVRMPPMDISDVAYDAFLINGQRQSSLPAKPGDRVRLRLINAGASSYFYAHSATGPLTVVAADGNDVVPFTIDRLLMGMAETYDVIVTVPDLPGTAWEFRATAQDNTGHASIFIGSGADRRTATPLPAPALYSMENMVAGALEDITSHDDDDAFAGNPQRPSVPYRHLRSTRPTALPSAAPVRTLTLHLTGDMTRYLWSINGKTLAEDPVIPVHSGEVLRVELINDTMMHHPMHLHGHFFRVVNRFGDHSPLKHTVDVPPMGRRTIEFLADEPGDWFFHCHLLYHMDAGMARAFSYAAATQPDHRPKFDPQLLNPIFFLIDGMAGNHMTEGNARFMRGRETVGLLWDVAYHHMTEYENDLYWSHYFSTNISSFTAFRFTNDEQTENRAVAGISYRLPYLVHSALAIDSRGDARATLSKEINLTPRLSLFGEAEYDTGSGWETSVGLSYQLTKKFGLTAGHHSGHGVGAGLTFTF